MVLSSAAWLPDLARPTLAAGPPSTLTSIKWRCASAADLNALDECYQLCDAALDHCGPASLFAVPGRARPAELRAALGCAADVRLALVAFGGFAKALPLEDWPEQNGLRILIPGLGQNPRPDVADPTTLDFSFSDLLASVDAVLTKPGYGTFVEAACAGIPVLYLRRPDWPEQDALIDWLHANARALEIDAATLARGTLAPALQRLWQQAPRPRPEADGAARVADLLSAALSA